MVSTGWGTCQFCYSRRDWLNNTFPHWIGRRSHVEWSLRSSDPNLLDFFFSGKLKEKVYSRKIKYLKHLRECITSHCSDNSNEDLLHRVHRNVAKHTHFCIANDANHVENALKLQLNKIVLFSFKIKSCLPCIQTLWPACKIIEVLQCLINNSQCRAFCMTSARLMRAVFPGIM